MDPNYEEEQYASQKQPCWYYTMQFRIISLKSRLITQFIKNLIIHEKMHNF